MENVMLLPHIGSESMETLHRMSARVVENIRAGLTTGHLLDLVPEQRS